MSNIDVEQMIYTAAAFRNTNVGAVAKRAGMSPSSLYKRILRNTLRSCDLDVIAKALGAEYNFYFLFPNGSKIGRISKPKPAGRKKAAAGKTGIRVI